jgi:hypothetical protein
LGLPKLLQADELLADQELSESIAARHVVPAMVEDRGLLRQRVAAQIVKIRCPTPVARVARGE